MHELCSPGLPWDEACGLYSRLYTKWGGEGGLFQFPAIAERRSTPALKSALRSFEQDASITPPRRPGQHPNFFFIN